MTPHDAPQEGPGRLACLWPLAVGWFLGARAQMLGQSTPELAEATEKASDALFAELEADPTRHPVDLLVADWFAEDLARRRTAAK